MIVQHNNLMEKRTSSKTQVSHKHKNYSSITLDQQLQFHKQLPIIVGNVSLNIRKKGSAYVSPKLMAPRRQHMSQEKQSLILRNDSRLRDSPERESRGRHQKMLQNVADSRPKTSVGKVSLSNQFYSYYVDKGNNSLLVKRILSRRSWLYEANTLSTVNIRWKQTVRDFNYANLSQNSQIQQRKVCINHLENHPEITTKTRLFLNLRLHCKKTKENIYEFVPATHLINLDSPTFQNELKDFIDYFCKIKQENIQRNVWLLKPPDLNRGQGIQLFNDIRVFINQLQEYCKAKQSMKSSRLLQCKPQMKNVIITYPADRSDAQKDSNGMATANFLLEQLVGQGNENRIVVLQKYLENPLLYNGRKFDFRVWVLIDHNLNYYFFRYQLLKSHREGYLRLATDTFEITGNSLRNKFIHLTNNAIQKHHERYGKFELGNQLSFSDLQNHCNMKGQKINVRDKIVTRMKELVKITLNSASDKLSQCINDKNLQGTRQFQYEIFGYDFMVDNQWNIWLIEINTNPCIEESSPLLQKLIPRMLNDAFRLTIDKIFPPPKSEMADEMLSEFSVPGYDQADNLWELLGKLTK